MEFEGQRQTLKAADSPFARLLRQAIPIIGIAVAYAVTGKLGLLLSIPPGYATAIWPPSGIALVALLVFGYRAWPGVFLGSFLVNFLTQYDPSTAPTMLALVIIPIAVASGAALQALVGAYCVRRFANFPNHLSNEREVFSFLFWGGPISCLISATVGVSTLLIAGKIPEASFWANLGTWWIGDVIGVFILGPLAIVWLLRPCEVWKPRRLTVTLSIGITFALALVAIAFGTNWERQRIKLQFVQQAAARAQPLEKTLVQHIEILHSIKSYFAASPDIDRRHFRIFVQRSFAELSGLQALSWNPRITQAERPKLERETQAEGFPGFEITERNADGELVRAGDRAEHILVHYLEPLKGNENAFGFDIASNPARREALNQARDTGKPIATSRITLVQEAEKQFGVLVVMPVYRNGFPSNTLETRRRNLKGYVVGVFRGGDIVKAALQGLHQEEFVYRLRDQSSNTESQFLFENRPYEQGIHALREMGIFGGTTFLEKTFPIDFAGREWVFEIAPTQSFLARHREENSWMILIAGMLLTTLVGAFILILSGRSNLLQNLVEERTNKLQLSESRLAQAQRIAVLGNWDWNVTKKEMWWSDQTYRIFEMAPDPSKATFESLLDSAHPDDREFLAQTIDTALNDNKPFDIDHRIVLSNGTEKLVNQHGELIFDDDGAASRMMGTVQDITERQKLSRMQNEFVATVSHELRTPLTSIKGSLGLIANGVLGALPEKAADLMSVAYRNVDRLTYLVNDILDQERIASGNMEFDFQTVDLSTLVAEAIESSQGLASQNGVTFVPANLASRARVNGDGNRLTQVITNLLSNAARFSPYGSNVEISVTHRGRTVRVSVADHGSGITESFRERIFGRFAQADGSNTRESGGTGLGLNISKSIVEIHDGELEFHSEVGVGSTFYFTLPAVDENQDIVLQTQT